MQSLYRNANLDMVVLVRFPRLIQVMIAQRLLLMILIVFNCQDPYHTYLGLTSVAIYPPLNAETWSLALVDPLINATAQTAQWALDKMRN